MVARGGRILAVVTLWLAVVPATAFARDCTASERSEADRQLWLNDRDKELAIHENMPWGSPPIEASATSEVMLSQRDYVIRYDGDLRVPLFTAERVVSARLGKVKRTDCFRPDVRVISGSASRPSDYDEAIFDQGHLAAFANQSTSQTAGDNSFIMTNMAPQTCQFNRGIWQILEGIVRLWASDAGTVYVVSGSVFDRDGDGLRDPDGAAVLMTSRSGARRVAVPTAFYKIVARLDQDGTTVRTMSFLLPHDQSNPEGDAAVSYLASHVTTLGDVEARTGLRFFADAPAIAEASEPWPFARSRLPRSLCHAAARADFDALWAEPLDEDPGSVSDLEATPARRRSGTAMPGASDRYGEKRTILPSADDAIRADRSGGGGGAIRTHRARVGEDAPTPGSERVRSGGVVTPWSPGSATGPETGLSH